MGTSTGFGGGKNGNPLIPSWLESGNTNNQNPEQQENSENRFREARRSMNSFSKSGGADRREIGKAIADYISKASGGTKKSVERMVSERRTAVKLSGILLQAGQIGIRDVARQLNLTQFADRPIAEVYAALVDVICQSGGDRDEAYVRDAYIEAIVEISSIENINLECPSIETISILMELFISNSIYNRILNTIANQSITLPSNIDLVKNIQDQLKDFIHRVASDAVANSGNIFQSTVMQKTMDSLFESTFEVLQALAQAEMNAGG